MSRDINTIPRKYIVSYQIHVEWNDSPKLVRLNQDMSSTLTHHINDWFEQIEQEENEYENN